MSSRRIGTVLAAPFLTAGLISGLAPASSAQELQTTQVPVTHSCIGVPYPNVNEILRNPPSWIPSDIVSSLRTLITTTTANTSEISDTITVTAPSRAEPGTEFTVRLQPGLMSRDRAVSRLSYDFQVPSGATLVSSRIVPGTAQGLTGEASLTRIDAAGLPNDSGQFLRLDSDNETVFNRRDWDDTLNNAPGWEDGLRAPANRQYRLPAIELSLVADDGAIVTTGLRTGPAQPASGQDSSTAFLTQYDSYSVRVVLFRLSATIGHANYCSAIGLGRQALSTTRVHSVHQTATDIEVQLEALTGDDVRITAEVDPNPGRGVVEFYDGDVRIGQSTVGDDGTAELVWKFRDPGTHSITARYVGDEEYLSSESEPRAVEVTVPGEVVIEPEPEEPVDPVFPEPETGVLGSLTGSLGLPAGTP